MQTTQTTPGPSPATPDAAAGARSAAGNANSPWSSITSTLSWSPCSPKTNELSSDVGCDEATPVTPPPKDSSVRKFMVETKSPTNLNPYQKQFGPVTPQNLPGSSKALVASLKKYAKLRLKLNKMNKQKASKFASPTLT